MKSNNQNLKIGFIGLGLMGQPMALNILKAGFPLGVFNRTLSKAKLLGKSGALVFSSPYELSDWADVVIVMVTGPKETEEVLFGWDGLVSERSKKTVKVVINMGTIGTQNTLEIATRLAVQKIKLLDAPVTGSTLRAISGELTIFASGDKKTFENLFPLFKAMGKDIFYIGPVGQGQAIKLVNNLLVGSTLTSLGEAFLLADAQKLSRQKVMEYLQNVPAVSAFMKLKMPNMVKRKYPVAFSVANMSKDLELARGELALSGQKLEVLEQVSKYYRQAKKSGLENQDNSAVMAVLEDNVKV